MRKAILIHLAVIAAIAAGGTCAQAGARHAVGADGYLLATLPPPGFYYKLYHVVYAADTYKDGSRSLPGDTKLTSVNQIHRVLWCTDKKILGANLIFDFVVPVAYTRMSGDLAGTRGNKDKLGVGDMYFEPILQWRGENWSFLFTPSVYLPTGMYDKNNPVSPGRGCFSFLATAGGSYFFGADRSWNVSSLVRYETSTTEFSTNVREGSYVHFEGSLGKRFGNWTGALVGLGSWQVSDARGKGAANGKRSAKQMFGPEIGYGRKEWGMDIQFKVLFEFKNRNSTQGVQTVLSVVKSF